MSKENMKFLEENHILPGLKTMENRGYYVWKKESEENLKSSSEPDETKRKSSWQRGALRSACEDVLARMNIASFQQININKSNLRSV
ncbi:uncharacterized protein [Fopius arisanus]|uniref:Uncharacterized protein isoform X2 n=1 Tax=Fopius arisanus TaxID=64838 RepID=A0A9R1TWR6_9HYME|nr:PREDICTED: uncharacterized protein LOC105264192 isoform X2 [Fopius arisanus]